MADAFWVGVCGQDIRETLSAATATRTAYLHFFRGDEELLDTDRIFDATTICSLTLLETPVQVGDEIDGTESELPWDKTPLGISWFPSSTGSFIAVRNDGYESAEREELVFAQYQS